MYRSLRFCYSDHFIFLKTCSGRKLIKTDHRISIKWVNKFINYFLYYSKFRNILSTFISFISSFDGDSWPVDGAIGLIDASDEFSMNGYDPTTIGILSLGSMWPKSTTALIWNRNNHYYLLKQKYFFLSLTCRE